MVVLSATRLSAQTVSITSPASGTTITAGSTITVSATRSNSNSYGGSGNWTWTFATSPTTGVSYSVNPIVVSSGSTQSTDITFANAGTYSVTVTVTRSGGATATSPAITIIVTAPPATATLSPSAAQNITTGGTVSFTATASNYTGTGNYTFTWNAVGSTGWSNVTQLGNSLTQTLTFPSAGTFTVNVAISRSGATTLTTNTTTVNVSAPANQPIGCNGQFFVSHGTAGTSTTTTSLEKLTFSSGIITANSYSGDPTGIGFNAIGINPLDGYMYGIRYSPMHLVKVGSGTPGNINDLGTITNANIASADNAYAGCFDANGDYYFVTDANEFYKITGINAPAAPLAATYLGTVSPSTNFFVDIAIDPTDGQMYGVAGTGTSGKNLYKVNKTNGALTLMGTYSGSNYIAALFFDEVGGLYGYRQDGTFQSINKATAAQTQVGTAATYTYADGCSCSFGRVFHDLSFTQGGLPHQICPSQGNPNPTFPLVVSVTNQTSGQQTGLTYTLNMVDPFKRFKFTESAATIAQNLFNAGLLPDNLASHVTLTTEAPATGTNYNKIEVTGFRTGASNTTLSFTIQVQLVGLGGTYNAVPLQSQITGLLAQFGSSDLSNDPATLDPDDPTTISFCPNIILPVKLISFTGTYKNNATTLNWVAENQTDFASYTIERSSDGINFSSIGSKPAQGSGNERQQYAYIDDLSLTTGTVFYYRLKMIDVSGNYKYSNVIMIRKMDKPLNGITISPNPAVNTDNITARISVSSSGKVELSIIDMAGRVVLRQQNQVSEGVNSIALNNLDKLQSGIYFLQMSYGNELSTVKFAIGQSK